MLGLLYVFYYNDTRHEFNCKLQWDSDLYIEPLVLCNISGTTNFSLLSYFSGVTLRRLIIMLVCVFNAIIGFVLVKSFFATDKTRKVLRMVDPTVPVMAYEPVMKQQNTDLGFLLQLASRDNLREKHPCFNLRKGFDRFKTSFLKKTSKNLKKYASNENGSFGKRMCL